MRSFICRTAALLTMLLAATLYTAPRAFASVSVPELNLSDFKAFNGTWQAVYLEMSGEAVPADMLGEVVVEFGNGMLAMQGETDRVRYAVNESASLKQFDVLESEGISRGIYRLSGDELTLCVAAKPNGERPTQFLTTAEEETVLIVLRRVK